MRRKNLLLPFCLLIILASSLTSKSNAQVTSLQENFDNVVPSGWSAINHSSNPYVGWAQGNTRMFDSYSGSADSYAGAGYLSVKGKGTINNWLITPELNFQNSASVSFYTRTTEGSTFPDRLEVRLSTAGSSTNVGSGAEGVGDFSTLLLTINPTLEEGGYPDTGWTQYTVAIPGGSSSGRIALRYYVTDAGSNGASNANYIGIDDFSFESVLPVSLLSFSGSVKNNKAFLTWSTANEINNKGFEVQSSRDNKNFSSVGFVTGHGSTSGVSYYNYSDDKMMLSGSNYYRLKQVDFDGNYRYSNVIKLDLQKFDWTIFGNLSTNAWIQLQTESQSNVSVQIVSLNGQTVQTINKGNLSSGTYTIPLNLQNASRGVYVIKLIIDKNIYSKKILR